MSTWAHLHLPRHESGDPNPISVKVPGERIEYVSWLSLTDVTFRVSQAGRRRCLRENVRNVHAWVVGTEVLSVTDHPARGCPPGYRRAVYDPWKGGAFVDAETLEPLLTARHAILSCKYVYYAS